MIQLWVVALDIITIVTNFLYCIKPPETNMVFRVQLTSRKRKKMRRRRRKTTCHSIWGTPYWQPLLIKNTFSR